MNSKSFMIVAGEPSGDALAAELIQALRNHPALCQETWPVRFFGAGGPQMAAAGVELSIDLTRHAVFGLTDALRGYLKFRQIFMRLLAQAIACEPEVIILVDFSGFNRRFAAAVRDWIGHRVGSFHNWKPRIIYYVSPQVWASRERRAYQLARDVDLILSIFPFEPAWYAERVPQLRVEFVGHPLIDRYAGSSLPSARAGEKSGAKSPPEVLLLPGSRRRELELHLPVLLEALDIIQSQRRVQARLVAPSPELEAYAQTLITSRRNVDVQIGGLAEALAESDLALACSGTVTLECAYFGVPAVVIYKTSWLTYTIGKRIIRVPYIAMPNILAGETVYPEFIQNDARPTRIASAALEFLNSPERCASTREKLRGVIESLGEPGAGERAANAVVRLLYSRAEDPGPALLRPAIAFPSAVHAAS